MIWMSYLVLRSMTPTPGPCKRLTPFATLTQLGLAFNSFRHLVNLFLAPAILSLQPSRTPLSKCTSSHIIIGLHFLISVSQFMEDLSQTF